MEGLLIQLIYFNLIKNNLSIFRYFQGPKHLSDLMRDSLSTDPVSPILLERHLLALDRRVKILLKTVYKCMRKNGPHRVVIDDGF